MASSKGTKVWIRQRDGVPCLPGGRLSLVAACGVGCLFLTSAVLAAEPVSGSTSTLTKIFAGRSPKSPDDLRAMETRFRELHERVSPAVVHLRVGASHGSGVIFSEDGYILTAAHVVGRPGATVVVQLSDGRVRRGETLGIHLQHDIAMVRIEGKGPWPFVPPAPRDSGSRGSWCIALGHTGGFDIERGPVLRVGRVLRHDALLRTDCTLNGGDSGGPLIDMEGRVIGIHSRIGVYQANNLHIPIAAVDDHWRRFTQRYDHTRTILHWGQR